MKTWIICCIGSMPLGPKLNADALNSWLQEALEAHDGVSKGKYTIGLGQDCMAFCSEVEDVISMRYIYCHQWKNYCLINYPVLLGLNFMMSRIYEAIIVDIYISCNALFGM
jgi:hypothetical protein